MTGVRLADGASPREGRLELQLLGRSEWLAVMGVGAVPSTIAEVACRQLNFTGGQLIDFPGGPTPISDLSCSGQEASLDECGLRYEPEGGSPVSLGVRCS